MTKNKKFGRKGVRHSRNSLKKYIVKGNLLHKEGKLGEALLITQEALKKFPNNSILLKRAGRAIGLKFHQ